MRRKTLSPHSHSLLSFCRMFRPETSSYDGREIDYIVRQIIVICTMPITGNSSFAAVRLLKSLLSDCSKRKRFTSMRQRKFIQDILRELDSTQAWRQIQAQAEEGDGLARYVVVRGQLVQMSLTDDYILRSGETYRDDDDDGYDSGDEKVQDYRRQRLEKLQAVDSVPVADQVCSALRKIFRVLVLIHAEIVLRDFAKLVMNLLENHKRFEIFVTISSNAIDKFIGAMSPPNPHVLRYRCVKAELLTLVKLNSGWWSAVQLGARNFYDSYLTQIREAVQPICSEDSGCQEAKIAAQRMSETADQILHIIDDITDQRLQREVPRRSEAAEGEGNEVVEGDEKAREPKNTVIAVRRLVPTTAVQYRFS